LGSGAEDFGVSAAEVRERRVVRMGSEKKRMLGGLVD